VDHSLFREVNDFARATGWLHAPFVDYAKYGVVLFAAALLASWWIARRSGDLARVSAALWAPAGALLALGLNQPLGHAVGEARPYATLPHVLVLVSRTTDFSFPSDHAVMAGAVAGGVLLVDRRLGVVVALAAVLMAFARVYVGAHYPGDVLAGLALGFGVAVGSHLLVRRPALALVRAANRTPLGVLLAPQTEAPRR
jgi:undecaprenyl-diphosphatase